MFHEKKLVGLRFKRSGFRACCLLDSMLDYSAGERNEPND